MDSESYDEITARTFNSRLYDRHHKVIGRIEDLLPLPKPVCNANALVFFDIMVDHEYVGRMIIELRSDEMPRTSENFRSLCTGERGLGSLGTPLHFKNTNFFEVASNYACGGDVLHNDGSGGDSIYGPVFTDENRRFKHVHGVLSMKSYGITNSYNSQFVLTCEHAPELDQSNNIVFGRILRGLPILYEMQRVCENNKPKEKIVIKKCGELKTTDEWGYCEFDTPHYPLPHYPRDWRQKNHEHTTEHILKILCDIRRTGNKAYEVHMFCKARRKYRKALRYYDFFMTRGQWEDFERLAIPQPDVSRMHEFACVTYNNMAAVELKLNKFENTIYYCSETIYLGKHCCKAYYRRGQAHFCLRKYAEAVRDFSKSALLNPSNKQIQNELIRAKDRLAKSRAELMRMMARSADSSLEDIEEETDEEWEMLMEPTDRQTVFNVRMASPTASSETL